MDREKDDRAEVERRVVAYPGVKFDDVVRQIGDPIAFLTKPRFDTPVQHFPQCGDTDETRHMAVFDRAGELISVLDLDCASLDGFCQEEAELLQTLLHKIFGTLGATAGP